MKNIFEYIHRKLPFTTPPRYFEDLPIHIEKRIQGEYVPEKISKQVPFSTPDQYFDLLAQKISQKVTQKKPVSGIAILWQPVWRYSLAASLVVAVGVWMLFPKSSSQPDHPFNIAQISRGDVVEYLKNEFQPEEFMAMAQTELSEEDITALDVPFEEWEVSENELESILINQLEEGALDSQVLDNLLLEEDL